MYPRMSDEYDGLDGLVTKVIEEACYAELRLYGWYPDGSGNVVYSPGGLGGVSQTAAGPGSGHPGDLVSPDGRYIDQTDNGLDAPATLGQVYQFWESAIPPIFAPFENFPAPHEFQELADHVRESLKQLSTEGNSGSGTSSSGASSANVDYEGNTTLGLADQVAQVLNTWQGGAAASFATYLNLFKEVVGNQALACEVLRMTLLMEKEMWTRMRGDVVEFARSSANAFQGCGGITVGDVKAALKVAGSVNTILGWFPAFKPATEAAGKGLTVAGLLVDTFGGKEPPPNELGARHFKDVLAKMKTHRDKLKQTSQTVEGDIKKSLENLKKHIDAAPAARSNGTADQESFRLSRPSGTYSADSTDDFIYPGVVVNSANVRSAADMLDRDIAPEMTKAATNLDDADSAWQWIRDDSSIGVGTFGCYSEYSAASYTLQKEIAETAKEMEWAAEMLRAVAADLDNTDNDVSDDLAGVRRKIDEYDNPRPVTVPSRGHQRDYE